MIKVEELVREGAEWKIKTLYLNPAWIIRIQEDHIVTKDLRGKHRVGKFPEGLDLRHTITKVTYASGSRTHIAIVVGTPESIHQKVMGRKQILRG